MSGYPYLLSIFFFLLMLVGTTPVQAVQWTGYKIAIDPSYGGNDPGPTGTGKNHAKELTLNCGLDLRTKLQAVGAPVTMTRASDVTLDLTARRAHFLNQDPWISVSIGVNTGGGSGTECYYYWETGNSSVLAQKTQARLVEQLGLNNRGVKIAAYTVLTAASSMPATATFGVFYDNSTNYDMIKDKNSAGFNKWVNGHLLGFWDHLKAFNSGLDNPVQKNLATNTTSLAFGDVIQNQTKSLTFTVTGTSLTNNITVSSSNNTLFTVSPTSLGAAGGTVTVTFKPTAVQNYSGTITISATGAANKTVSVGGAGKSAFNLTQKWNFSDQNGNPTSKGWDARSIRNMTYANGKLYLVYNHADIKVIKSQSGDELYNLNKTGVSGGVLTLCDVGYFDGKVIACNIGQGTTPLKVYVWDSDSSEPRKILETTSIGGAARLGDCIGFTGTWASGKLTFANDDGTTTRIVNYAVTNGVVATTPTVVNATKDNERLACSSSIRIQPDASGYWINGKDNAVTRLNTSGVYQYELPQTNKHGNGFSAFTYDGKSYAVATRFVSTTNYVGGAMELFDANAGWANANVIGTYPSAAGLGTTANTYCTGGCYAQSGTNYVEAWVLSTGQGMAYYTYGTPPSITPTITVTPDEYDFGDVNVNETKSVTINVTGFYFGGNISISSNNGAFTLEKSSLGNFGGSFKVYFKPTTEQNYDATM